VSKTSKLLWRVVSCPKLPWRAASCCPNFRGALRKRTRGNEPNRGWIGAFSVSMVSFAAQAVLCKGSRARSSSSCCHLRVCVPPRRLLVRSRVRTTLGARAIESSVWHLAGSSRAWSGDPAGDPGGWAGGSGCGDGSLQVHPGGNSGANLKLISHRCHPILVAFLWELTQETIYLPLGCLQGGSPDLVSVFGFRASDLGA